VPVFYECQRCAACCRWPGQVKVDDAEIRGMAALLELPEADFIERYTRVRVDRRGLTLIEGPDGACIFLEGGGCRVQPAKPQQCRDFPNRWRFPGFERHCESVARVVDDAEYDRLVRAATGLPPVPGLME